MSSEEVSVILAAAITRPSPGPRSLLRTFACDHEEVVPDVYVLGKALGGGLYPVLAIAADGDVLGVITPGLPRLDVRRQPADRRDRP
jgi:hypothetical protein